MVFSSKLSKFGKGENLSAFMDSKSKIDIYYFNNMVEKKEVLISNKGLELKYKKINLPYNEVLPITNHLITRLEKSIGIILKNESNN